MKLVKIVAFASFLILNSAMAAQSSLNESVAEISYYSDIVANAAQTATKSRANSELVPVLENFLATEGSFQYSLGEGIWLSVQVPENGEWRIITWEMKKEEGSDYFGYLQKSNGEFIKLNDASDDMDDIEYSVLDKDYWYGALYYNIIEGLDPEGKPYFILFGYNNYDKFNNRKVAEVLSFENGVPVFGKEVFIAKDEDGNPDAKNRLMLEYSSDSNVGLNFNQGMGMIVYDHLISRMGRLPEQGPTMLPDGSYCGYKPEEGKWIYVDKLFNEVSTTVPRPKPILDGNKRNIFGKKN